MNFLQAKTLVLNYLRRPAAEIGDEVGDAINRAIRWAVASHDFVILERIVITNYSSGRLVIPFSELFCDDVKSIKSLQLLAQKDDKHGDALKFIAYEELQRSLQRSRDSGSAGFDLLTSAHIAFVMSSATKSGVLAVTDILEPALGLFPCPEADAFLLAHLNLWGKKLIEDVDTNFILTYFPNFILYYVCTKLLFYLRSDDRSMFTAEAVDREWENMLKWDMALRSSSGGLL